MLLQVQRHGLAAARFVRQVEFVAAGSTALELHAAVARQRQRDQADVEFATLQHRTLQQFAQGAVAAALGRDRKRWWGNEAVGAHVGFVGWRMGLASGGNSRLAASSRWAKPGRTYQAAIETDTDLTYHGLSH
jgi:hypothetical protein